MSQNNSGCVMLYLDNVNFNELVTMLDIENTQLTGDGVVNEPHVTVIYGIPIVDSTFSFDVEFIKDTLIYSRLINETFNAESISYFRKDKYDVLKFDLLETSGVKNLREINSELTEGLKVKSEFEEYKPHCTVAYLTPNSADEYVQVLPELSPMKVSKIVFSYKKDPNKDELSKFTLLNNRSIVAQNFIRGELF